MSTIQQAGSRGAQDVLRLTAAIHAQRDQGINEQLNLRTLVATAQVMAEMATMTATPLEERRDDAVHAAARLLAFAELVDLATAERQAVAA